VQAAHPLTPALSPEALTIAHKRRGLAA
jgi:hypothetical protein